MKKKETKKMKKIEMKNIKEVWLCVNNETGMWCY